MLVLLIVIMCINIIINNSNINVCVMWIFNVCIINNIIIIIINVMCNSNINVICVLMTNVMKMCV